MIIELWKFMVVLKACSRSCGTRNCETETVTQSKYNAEKNGVLVQLYDFRNLAIFHGARVYGLTEIV